MFLPWPQSQDREVSHAHNATSTFYSPAELGRRVGTPRIQLKDVVSLLITRHARHVGLVVFRVNRWSMSLKEEIDFEMVKMDTILVKSNAIRTLKS